MSSCDVDQSESHPKCTKGDKCILIHIAVSFLVILILVAIYVVHIFLVKHEGFGAFRVTRRSLDQPSNVGTVRVEVPNYSCIGVVYITSSPPKLVCNSVAVKPRWSLAPAHCVTARTEPELAHLLPKWRIRYQDTQYKESDIKTGVVHSYYNKDESDNNVGLFEHLDHILLPEFNFPVKVVSDLLQDDAKDLVVVGWNTVDEPFSNPVRLLDAEKCSQFISAIVNAPRKAELCVLQNRDERRLVDYVHGAALLLDSQIVGFFSWGDRTGAIPQVVLTIAPYRTWLESMIAIIV